MTQWSDPIERVSRCMLRDGRKVTIVTTYVNLIASEPFCNPVAASKVLQQLVTNVEIDGDITADESVELLEWLKTGCETRPPMFIESTRGG